MSTAKLDTIVLGTIKYSWKQLSRERKTRFGLASVNRNVLDEFPHDIPDSAPEETQEVADSDYSRMRAIVQGQIREIVSKPEYIELIERRLLNGECLTSVADHLGINRQTARSQVWHAKNALGLKRLKLVEC